MSCPPSKFNLGDMVRDEPGGNVYKIIGKGYSLIAFEWFYILNAEGSCGKNWFDGFGQVSFLQELEDETKFFWSTRECYMELVSKNTDSLPEDEDRGGLNYL